MITEQQKEKQSTTVTKNGVTVKPDQLVFVSEKVWGHEEWIANNAAYCGKKMVFNAGYQFSMHHHKIKDETFYVQSGKILLETDYNGKQEKRIMTTGDTVHIPQNMWHRITALEAAEIFEFSTFHKEEDSYRRTTASKVDLKTLGIEI